MTRVLDKSYFMDTDALNSVGLTPSMIIAGIKHVYHTLDLIDKTLLAAGESRLSKMIELPNLSSMIGNLFASGIAKASDGTYTRNRSHAYQDLKALIPGASSVEVKVALEDNNPKGHHAKPGYYLVCRYVLCDAEDKYNRGTHNRGEVVWIWEVRFGNLDIEHFNISNTPGDSGKTAVINAKGMQRLSVLYYDIDRCPYASGGKKFRELMTLRDSSLSQNSISDDLP